MRILASLLLRLIGATLCMAALLGFLNSTFDWNLILAIKGAHLDVGRDQVVAGANLVLGIFLVGLGSLIASDGAAAWVRTHRMATFFGVVAFIGTVVAGGFYAAYRLSGGAPFRAAEQDDVATLTKLIEEQKVLPGDLGELLERAVRHKSVGIVKLLAPRAPLAQRYGESAYTVLDAAVLWSSPGTVAALLAAGAPVDLANRHGHTPLHAVILYREGPDEERRAIVKLLLARGARKDTRDRWKKTPLDHARDRGLMDLVQLLVRRTH